MGVKEMLFGNKLEDMMKFSVKELKRFAKELEIKGFSTMNKQMLAIQISSKIA